MKILYFARLRETFGMAQEQLDQPVADVAALLEVLRQRGGVFAEELAAGRNYRVAVNQLMASPSTPLGADDEVAIFPPVTGG